jgi:hypothetical protein
MLYCILTDFDMRIKVVRSNEMRLIETCGKVHVGRYLSDTGPIQNCLKQGNALAPLFFNFTLGFLIRKAPKTRDELKLNRTY